jgi:hypothetical protein
MKKGVTTLDIKKMMSNMKVNPDDEKSKKRKASDM